MAVTDTQQWTMQRIGDKLVELGNGQHTLKTDLMKMEDRLTGLARDVGAIKRHLGVPDDA